MRRHRAEHAMRQELIARLEKKYLWWNTPDGTPHETVRVLAQVMELGTHEDAEALRAEVGDEVLRDVLRHAQAGWVSAKSWHYWHYTLRAADFGKVPDLPARRFA